MEMGNVPKRQQPDHRKKQQQKVTNRSSMQREIPAPGGVLQQAHKQIYTSSVIMNAAFKNNRNTQYYICLCSIITQTKLMGHHYRKVQEKIVKVSPSHRIDFPFYARPFFKFSVSYYSWCDTVEITIQCIDHIKNLILLIY